MEKLSLRALAREAGVSQTAPYRHFPTKKCLLAALATQGFKKLTEQVQVATSQPMSVEDRFIAMGCAYVQFALDNPTSYHLMFGAVVADFSEYNDLREASSASYAHVLEMLQELMDVNQLDYDLAHLGGVVWSGVHGMASLLLNKANGGLPMDVPDMGPAAPDSPFAPIQSLLYVRQDIDGSLRMLFGSLLRA